MPLYEFQCDACSLVFEELVRSSSEAVVCPKCGDARVTRQLSTFAAHGLGAGPSGGAQASGGSGCGGCSGGNCSSCH